MAAEVERIDPREQSYQLLTVLQAHAPTGKEQAQVAAHYNQMIGAGEDWPQIVRSFSTYLAEGLNTGHWPWVWLTKRQTPTMDKAAYDSIVATLVQCHPEDLVNIISRVMSEREDFEITHEQDENSRLQQGNITIPAFVEHGDTKDRLFKLALDEVL